MKTRIIALICAFTLIFSTLLFVGCTTPSSVEKVTVTFQYDKTNSTSITIDKGGFVIAKDMPAVKENDINYSYDWNISSSTKINEDTVVEPLKYTKGVQLQISGSKAKITGMQLEVGQSKPTALILPTYYKGAVVTVIDQKSFRSYEDEQPCTEIRMVKLPDYLETIGYEAFEFCRKLESPKFPETLTFVGSNAFNGASFDTLVLPEGLTNLAKRAFGGGNHTFTYVKVPSSVEVMESYAIVSKVLQTIIIPKSVKRIEDGGIWPIEPIYKTDEHGKLVYENGYPVPVGYNDFFIFYEGDIYDWEDLYANTSDVDVANIVGDGTNDDFDKLISLHSSRDMVDQAIVYIYSETEPKYDSAHQDNKYWCYDEDGEIYIWDDPSI